MKNIRSHFKFNKQERSGIFFLLLIIVVLQIVYFLMKADVFETDSSFKIDTETQELIDELKAKQATKDTVKVYPFNPNFISDYKGYILGMSVAEIDRLHNFRAKNSFVNSAKEFQKVTQVSDSLLAIISPQFKFPEWTQKSSVQTAVDKTVNSKTEGRVISRDFEIKDLNVVTAAELKIINGIGETLSARIIKFRNRLGGFLVNEQLYDVYGLEPVVVERTLQNFQVLEKPIIQKVNLNIASAEELSQIVYLTFEVAEDIVVYREKVGRISSFDELMKIPNFPIDRINRIRLYLTL